MHLLTKFILISIAVWWVALVALFLFPHALPVISGFAILLSLPIALALLIVAIVALVKDKKRIWPAFSIGLIVLVTYIALQQIMFWGAFANFYLHRNYYEMTARSVVAAPTEAEQKQICHDGCWLLASKPPTVSFHYIHGFLNWHDIVYDPSGAVMTARTKNERLEIDTYFVSAEHLTGDWYLCHFGD